MIKNEGPTDRWIRFIIGAAFLVNAIIFRSSITAVIVLSIIGLVLLVTSFTGFCLLYKPLKICTVPGCKCHDESCEEEKSE